MTVHTMKPTTVSICPVCGGPIFSAFANKTMYTNMAAHSICLLEPDLSQTCLSQTCLSQIECAYDYRR